MNSPHILTAIRSDSSRLPFAPIGAPRYSAMAKFSSACAELIRPLSVISIPSARWVSAGPAGLSIPAARRRLRGVS